MLLPGLVHAPAARGLPGAGARASGAGPARARPSCPASSPRGRAARRLQPGGAPARGRPLGRCTNAHRGLGAQRPTHRTCIPWRTPCLSRPAAPWVCFSPAAVGPPAPRPARFVAVASKRARGVALGAPTHSASRVHARARCLAPSCNRFDGRALTAWAGHQTGNARLCKGRPADGRLSVLLPAGGEGAVRALGTPPAALQAWAGRVRVPWGARAGWAPAALMRAPSPPGAAAGRSKRILKAWGLWLRAGPRGHGCCH